MKRRDDAICDVNWLTAINSKLLERVGGAAKARERERCFDPTFQILA